MIQSWESMIKTYGTDPQAGDDNQEFNSENEIHGAYLPITARQN
jgi:hypothetical protein